MYTPTKEEIVQAIRQGKIKDRKSLEDFVLMKSIENHFGSGDNFKFIYKEKGDKGDTPRLGIDYMTPAEVEAIKKAITPVKGKHYSDGAPGKDGKDGINGKDGRDGNDGINGLDGANGKDGRDGKDGKDGSPDTGEQILEKLNKGKIKLITQDILDRAISILDQRTQFLINKVSNLAAGGTGGSAVYRDDGTISGTTITLTRNATTVLGLYVNGQFFHNFTHTSGANTITITSDEAVGYNGNDYTVIYI